MSVCVCLRVGLAGSLAELDRGVRVRVRVRARVRGARARLVHCVNRRSRPRRAPRAESAQTRTGAAGVQVQPAPARPTAPSSRRPPRGMSLISAWAVVSGARAPILPDWPRGVLGVGQNFKWREARASGIAKRTDSADAPLNGALDRPSGRAVRRRPRAGPIKNRASLDSHRTQQFEWQCVVFVEW